MRYLRLIRYVAIALVIVGALLLYRQRQSILEYSRQVLVLQLSSFLGEHVSIDQVKIDIFNLTIHARGIHVDAFDGSADQPLVQLDGLSVQLAEIPNARSIRLRSIKLVRPRISLTMEDGKLQHFSSLQEAGQAQTSTGQGPKLDIESVEVIDGALSVNDAVAGWAFQLAPLSGELTLMDGAPGRVSLDIGGGNVSAKGITETLESLRARAVLSTSPALVQDFYIRIPGAEARASGKLWMENVPDNPPEADLNVRCAGDLSALNRLLPALPHFEGSTEIAGNLRYTDRLHAGGTLTFRNTRIEDFDIGNGTLEYDVTPEKLTIQNGVLPRGAGTIRIAGEVGLSEHLPIRVSAELEQEQLADLLEDLSLTDPWVMLNVTGTAEVEGQLSDPVDMRGHVNLHTENFGLWDDSFHRATPENQILALSQADVNASVHIDENAVWIEKGVVTTPASEFFVDGAIKFDESMDLLFDAVRLDLSEVTPLAGFEIAGRGWGKGHLVGPFADLVISADMSLFGTRFDDYALGDLEGQFLAPVAAGRYLTQYLTHEEGGGRSRLEGTSMVGLDRLVKSLNRIDVQYYQGQMIERDPTMLMIPDARLRIGKTRVTGQGAIIFTDPLIVCGKVSLPAGLDAPLSEAGALADILSVPGLVWDGDPINGALYGEIEVDGEPLELNGQGRFELRQGEVYGQHVTSATSSIRLQQGALLLDELTATTGEGSLAVAGRLGPDGSLQATAHLDRLPLTEVDAIRESGLIGWADGSLVAAGSLEKPILQGLVSLTGTEYEENNLGVSIITVNTFDEELHIEGLLMGEYGRIQTTVGLKESFPYKVTLEMRNLSLEPFLTLGSDVAQTTRSRVGGFLWAEGELKGEQPPHVMTQVDDLTLYYAGLTLQNAEPVTLELYNGRFLISPATLEGAGTELSIEGAIEPDGTVNIDLGGNFNMIFLGALIPDVFERIEGKLVLRGSGLGLDRFHIGGTTSALTFEGQALVSEAAISTEYFPPTIDQLSGTINVGNDNEVRISELSGHLGGGTIEGRGLMTLGPEYYPDHYDLEVNGKDAFVRYLDYLPPGLMDAKMKFYGNVDNLLMSGDIYLKRMVYRERYNWEKYLTDFKTYRLEDVEVVDESPSYFDIDLRIHAPGTFFIRNNLGKVQLKGDLALTGDTNVLELRGEVESERGTVSILDNSFDLTRAKIEFTGDYWNPRLDIRLQTQIQSYTIYYEITGTLENWKLTPGSDSGLSERDINSLIAFGTLADNITEGNEARAVAAPALEFLIGRLGVLEQLQTFTRLDRFTIIPASDEAGNVGARVYGEKELIPQKLFFSGYYDYAVNGNQEFLMDLEWRTFNCCSLIFRLDSDQALGATAVRPGARLKLKLEFE